VEVHNNESVYNVLVEDLNIKDTIKDTQIKKLHICPANIDLAGAEVELVSMVSRETRLKEAIDSVRDEYDFVFIDCPPSLGLITLNAFTASDSVLVPIQCEYYALEGLGQLINTIKLVQKHLNKELEIEGVVLTMFDARTNLSSQVAIEVEKYFGNKVFQTIIPRNIRLSEAPSHGLPISLYDPDSKGAQTYKKLAKELLKLNEKGE
jgi:chromosome partitioning protein